MVGRLILAVTVLAVGGAYCRVVESRLAPVRGVVAGGTLPGEVIGRLVLAVAVLAVGSPGSLVVEGRLAPVDCIMAGGALPGEVVGRLILVVAALAVRGSGDGVIESHRRPGSGRVAGGAIPGKMAGRFIPQVASHALARGAPELPVRVAGQAIQVGMPPLQREEGVDRPGAARREDNLAGIDAVQESAVAAFRVRAGLGSR